MERIGQYFFDIAIMQKVLPFLLSGLLSTIYIAIAVIVLGLGLGLVLACIRAYQIRWINLVILAFVDSFRAIPELVILIVAYFALPEFGIRLSAMSCVIVVLALVMAAFSEEIFWSGITSVPRGQWEAGRSTGLNFSQVLFSIVLLQGIQLVIPPLTNKMISITKGTALASVISVSELLNQASSQQAIYANPTPLTLAAVLYLLIFVPLVLLSRMVEAHYAFKK